MKEVLLVLLTLFQFKLLSQSPIQFEIYEQKAQQYLDESQRDSVKLVGEKMLELAKGKEDTSLAISMYFLSEGLTYENPERSIELGRKAAKTFKENKMLMYQARSLKSIGNGLKLLSKYDESVASFEEALSILQNNRSLGNIKFQATLNYGIGATLREKSEYQKAIFYLQRADSIAETIDNKLVRISAMIQIAAIFFEIENFIKSKEYFLASSALAQDSQYENLRYFIDNGLAHIYRQEQQIDSALLLFRSAYDRSKSSKDEVNAAVYLFNIADLLILKEDYEGAKLVSDTMVQISQKLGITENIAFGKEIDSRFYASKAMYEQAIESALLSLQISEELGDPEQTARANRNLFDIYRSAGRSADALEAYLSYDQISDSLLSEKNVSIVEGLESKYESEKKDLSIEQLTQQNQIQELQLSRSNLWLAIVIVISFSGLLVGYLLYNQRTIKREKEANDLKQKLLRVQLNPHFMFNSLNAIQSMIYEMKDRQKTADYLSSFSSLMRNILELNQHDYITLEEELDFIENYIEVQQMRFDNPILYHLEVDDTLRLEELLVPPMITQPFLENSFEHGFPDKSKNCEIWIKVAKGKDWLETSITDNGIGFKISNTKKKSHNSLATKITEERLSNISTLFKRESGIAIHDLYMEGKTQGAEVIIKLPLIYD